MNDIELERRFAHLERGVDDVKRLLERVDREIGGPGENMDRRRSLRQRVHDLEDTNAGLGLLRDASAQRAVMVRRWGTFVFSLMGAAAVVWRAFS